MKKKLLIALLTACLILSMIPMAFAASTTHSVNTADKLTAALEAAVAGDTIKLTGDITMSESVVLDKAITFNGNGYKLTSSAATAMEVAAEGKVTVKDLKIVGVADDQPVCGVLISEKAEVTLTNLQIRQVERMAVYLMADEAKLTVSGGRLVSAAALWVEGDQNTVTVKNADLAGDNTVSGTSATVVVVGEKNTVTVTGGSVSADQDNSASQYLVGGECVDCTVTLNTELTLRNGAGYYSFGEDEFDLTGVTLSLADDYQEALTKKGIATAKGGTGLVTVKGAGVVKDANGVLYASLTDAFAAGGEIILTQDLYLTETAVVAKGKSVTLDLAGYEITVQKTGIRSLYAVDNYGTFTLKDSSEEQTGTIIARGVENFGTMTINGGTVVACDTGGAAIWNEGKLTVNGGTFQATHEGSSSDTYGPGCLIIQAGATATINGGTFDSANYRTYAIVSDGTLTINGEKTVITAAHGGIGINAGTATINNCVVEVEVHYAISNEGGKVTVNGGTFTGGQYGVDVMQISGGSIVLKGGTYANEPDADLIVSGKQAIQTVGGKWILGEPSVAKVGSTKYATLQEAIDAAMKKKGGTVTLLRDAIVSESVVIDGVYASAKDEEKDVKTYGTIVLDLAGYSVGAADTFDGDSVIVVGRQCTLTVKDSSKEATGAITYNGNESVMVGVKLTFNGDVGSGTATLNVQGGTIIGYEIGVSGNGMRDRTKITVEGGKIQAAAEQVGVGIYHPQNGTLNITGGEIEAATGIEMRAGSLIINGGTITATGTPASDSPNGSGSTVVGAAVALSQHSTEKRISLTVNGGTLTGAAAVYEVDTVNGETNVSIYLKDAFYSGKIYSENCTGFVYNGLYSEDMSEYCANGKTAVANTSTTTNGKYPFAVGVLGANAAEVEHGDASVNVPADATGDVLDANEYLVDNADDISVEGSGLDAAAANVANDNKYTTADGAEALGDGVNPADVTIVIETYMDVAVVDVAEDGTVTLDIAPMYRTLADNGSETAVLDEGKALKITGPVTVSIPVDLPDGEDYFVKHTHGKKTYIYNASVSNGILTFVNPNGFSTFTVCTDVEIVAKIGDVSYATLADAVRAVRDGETIVLQKDIQGSVIVKRTVEFYLDRNDCTFTGAIKAGDNCKNKSEEADHYIFEYSGGGGGGSDDTFTEDGNADDEEVNAEGDNYHGGGGGGGGEDWDWENPFTDVDEDDWFYDAVAYVVQIGMMNGTNDGTTFSPELKMTRGMLMTMLARLAEVDTTGGETWYSVGVEWAVSNGIAKEGDPNANITREEIASMLWKYAGGYSATINMLVNHPDSSQVSDWAREAMNWAVYMDLFEGNENGELNPQGEATRMEVATLIMRFCENILDM